jgi:hypothetical protein
VTSRESIELLDGGEQAYPRMLRAIADARRSVHLEVYAFALVGVGAQFIDALAGAAARGVKVHVLLDGWGSARGGLAVASALRQAGCSARIHNRLLGLFIGRVGRNHRKVLLVDDDVAFLGGINIGDENIGDDTHAGWADLALEIRGPQAETLGRMIRREPKRVINSAIRIHLCGPGGGWRMRRLYLRAFASATDRIDIAHGYFLPDLAMVPDGCVDQDPVHASTATSRGSPRQPCVALALGVWRSCTWRRELRDNLAPRLFVHRVPGNDVPDRTGGLGRASNPVLKVVQVHVLLAAGELCGRLRDVHAGDFLIREQPHDRFASCVLGALFVFHVGPPI